MVEGGSGPGSTQNAGALQLIPQSGGRWLLGGSLFLPDRPGELAEVAGLIARQEANIELFAYNRSQNPNLVRVAACLAAGVGAGRLADQLRAGGYLEVSAAEAGGKVEITDPAGLLRIRLHLNDEPGALAAFARILKEHRANVLYLAYDSGKSPGVAEMAMATACPQEVSLLLQDLNGRGYHYHVEWQGANGGPIDDVIGLSMVERFLLNLKAVLPPEKLDELQELIQSSEELRQTLLSFKREGGQSDESMAASAVFTSILQLATSSLSKTGRGFSLRLTGPLELTGRVSLYMLSCPTGANGYLLKHGEEYTLIDSSYGVYWPDVKKWLRGHGIEPARIRRALFTHPDADHAGWAARLEEEFGTQIYMHPDSAAIFQHENRAHGSGTRLMALNAYYTKLINRFTDLRAPKVIRPFPPASGQSGPFTVVGRVEVGDLSLQVLQSLGGHVPAQVFFYCPEPGLLFCGDYLIDLASLSERSKSTLSIAKYLMTSTNSDGSMFGREMRHLARLMLETEAQARRQGAVARVFPGHGDYYRVDEAEAILRGMLGAEGK